MKFCEKGRILADLHNGLLKQRLHSFEHLSQLGLIGFFGVKNGGVLIDYRFLIVDNCLLVYGVTAYDVKVYDFWTRCFG